MLTALQTEVWSEFAIGASVLFFRFFARIKVVGIKGLQLDDVFAFLALVFWTVDAATVQIVSTHGSLVGLTVEKSNALTDEEADLLLTGSKALFVAWLSYTSLIWCLKASLLFFYRRLTLGLWQANAVKTMGVICVVTYVATMLAILCHCTPVPMNWQIKPYPGERCVSMAVDVLTIAVLNITTDLCILAVPIPLLWRVRIPLGRKLVIGLLLCSGLFVITAAIIRAVLTMGNDEEVDNADIWGVRETFVSLIAVSAPAIRPLFMREHWTGKTSDASKGIGYADAGKVGTGHELTSSVAWNDGNKKAFNTTHAVRLRDDSSSEVYIIQKEGSAGSGEGVVGPLKIEVTTDYESTIGGRVASGWGQGNLETKISGGRFKSPV